MQAPLEKTYFIVLWRTLSIKESIQTSTSTSPPSNFAWSWHLVLTLMKKQNFRVTGSSLLLISSFLPLWRVNILLNLECVISFYFLTFAHIYAHNRGVFVFSKIYVNYIILHVACSIFTPMTVFKIYILTKMAFIHSA